MIGDVLGIGLSWEFGKYHISFPKPLAAMTDTLLVTYLTPNPVLIDGLYNIALIYQ